ncbi:hypothetical protein Tco_0601973 [Tanacetum coccineum]
MANIRTCNKHNMIACVEKTEHNADFHQIVDYLTGCSINYSLLVDPDLIGPWLQQFWATASLRVINEVPHIRAMVAGKRILISEETIWLIYYSTMLMWKILVHVLLHCLSPKSTSWEQFGTNIASALVGLATNQKFNFSLMIMNGMLGHITNVTLPQEVITKLAAEEAHSESLHSRAESSPRDAQGTPTQSAAQASILQGTAEAQGAADIPQSPNDYTPTDESQTSGGDEIHKLTAKLKKLSKGVKPLVKHHILWVKSQKLKKRGKKQKKKVSSVKLGRNKDEDVVTSDLERKSDETEQVIIEEEKDTSDVKSGDTEELDLERIQSTARQSAVTPRTLNFDDEAGPSSPIRPTQEEEPEEQFKDDESLADISLNISRPRGLSIPGPIALETAHDEEVARKVQAEWDAEEERKRLEDLKKPKPKTWDVEEERKRLEDLKKPKPKTISKKPTSLAQERNQMMSFLKGQVYKNVQKLRYPQMKELYDKVQESIKDSFKDFIPMGSENEKQMLQERDAKRLLRKRKVTVTEEQPSKKLKLRTETIDELRNYLRIVDFEKSAQDRVTGSNLYDYRI